MKTIKWTHKELVRDLALSFDLASTVVFAEQHVASGYKNAKTRKRALRERPIPDVLAVSKSYTKPNIRIYEVKATKADLNGDLQTGKYKKYLPFCERFYFALSPSIKDWQNTITDKRYGVVIRRQNSWQTARAAQALDPPEWDMDTLLCLLFGRFDDKGRMQRILDENRMLAERDHRKLLGGFKSWWFGQLMDLERRERELEYKIAQSKGAARRAIMEELYKTVNVNSRWLYGTDRVENLVNQIFVEPLRKAFNKALGNYESVVKKLEEEDEEGDEDV